MSDANDTTPNVGTSDSILGRVNGLITAPVLVL